MNDQNEYVKSQIEVWGFDYIESLFDKGYEPILVEKNGKLEWTWLLNTKVIAYSRNN